jgi:phosphomannomutase
LFDGREILERHGITPVTVAEAAPTPAFAYAVVQTEADGVINFTASHNPPQYNGIKFSTPDGCPALPEVTSRIEAEIEAEDRSASLSGAESSGHGSARESLDVKQGYLKRLREIVDLDVIRKANLRVCFDPMWGAWRGDTLMSSWQRPESRFGPCSIIGMYCLADMRRSRMITCWTICAIRCGRRARRLVLRLTVMRIGLELVDGDGTFLQPNYVIALLFDYLVESRGWNNGVAKSVRPPT